MLPVPALLLAADVVAAEGGPSSTPVLIVTAIAVPLIGAVATVATAMIGARAQRAARRVEAVEAGLKSALDECQADRSWMRAQFTKFAEHSDVQLDPYPQPKARPDDAEGSDERPRARARRRR